eukprot:s590_g15.t1
MLNRKDLALSVRAGIFNTVVTASFFNLGLWIPSSKAWSILSNAYSRLVRRLLNTQIRGEKIFHVPLPVAHVVTGCWTLDLVARRARLSLLASLAAHGPELLWAALQAEQTWLAVLREDLRWFVGPDHQDWPPLEAAAWPEWRRYLKDRPTCFKRRVVRRLKASYVAWCEGAVVQVCHWGMLRSGWPTMHDTLQSVSWKCWPCGRCFDTKAKLSVHFFKKHQRVAEYRHCVQGTLCTACGKQFWSGGTLAAHLRATPQCVATLQRSDLLAHAIQPGFGSKKMRQTELENYTPAVPERIHAGISAADKAKWFGNKKLLYEAACDVALETGEGTAFEAQLRDVLAKFPAYPAEISEILTVLAAEIQEISDSEGEQQWSRETSTAMRAACFRVAAEASEEREIIAPQQRQETFESFQRHLAGFDWHKEVQAKLALYGTQASTLVILPVLWEAEWRKSREVFASSAVLDQTLELLPAALKEAWELFCSGKPVRIRAPEAFWSHPVAEPFAPFREDASN